jgi:hypothetical protein
LTRLASQHVDEFNYPAQEVYEDDLDFIDRHPGEFTIGTYRSSGSVEYTVLRPDRLVAATVSNPRSLWTDPAYEPYFPAPPGNEDDQFRRLTVHAAPSTPLADGAINEPSFRVIGRFDPELLPGFSSLSQVPLESYYPPTAEPADAASKAALKGAPLLPTMNLGGYIAQPPLMLTTLDAARTLTENFSGVDAEAPISVIRVRVAGVRGPDPASLERIKSVALAIHNRTGLAVDITAGSSPQPLEVQLPAGDFGQPPLVVREGWTRKGVAVVILRALDRKSLVLFSLVLLVTAFFLVNASLASVRTRRAEVGTLMSLGWSRLEVFRMVLGEVALIGALAGMAGAAIGALLVMALSLRVPVAWTLLVPPVAVLLAAAAGALPAWSAAGGSPLDAVRPSVTDGRRGRRPIRGLAWMALENLRRVPGRSVLGALGLLVGVGSLSVLLAINLAFRGTVAGTVLGRVISIRVRGVDYAATILVVLLGALSVVDVLFLNLRERAQERAALQASGWATNELRRVVAFEGLGVALMGSVPGAGLGVVLAVAVGTPALQAAFAGAISVAAAVVIVVIFSTLPIGLVSRLTPWAALSEE